jgi:TRAP-type C4-dicarboxylate transport system permease small subunit
MFLATIFRYILDRPWQWPEEVLVYLMAWMMFILIGPIARQRAHIRIGFLIERITGSPSKAESISSAMENIIGLGIGIFFAYAAVRWMNISREMGIIVWSATGVSYPQWLTRIVPMLGLCLMAFFYLERSIRMILHSVVRARLSRVEKSEDSSLLD